MVTALSRLLQDTLPLGPTPTLQASLPLGPTVHSRPSIPPPHLSVRLRERWHDWVSRNPSTHVELGLHSQTIGARSTLPGKLEVRRSSHGLGVFALCEFKAGDPIILVTGLIKQSDSDQDTTYIFSMDGGGNQDCDLDLSGHKANIVKFVNSAGVRRNVVGTSTVGCCGTGLQSQSCTAAHTFQSVLSYC